LSVNDDPGPGRARVAVVVGGGSGIGAEAALQLARRGAIVVVVDPGAGVYGEPLGEPTAELIAKRITAAGGQARSSTISVTDGDALGTLFGEVVRDFGALDIVLNTAGILRHANLREASEDDWRSMLDIHLNGYLNVLSAALPIMIDAGYGRIVAFTSGAGLARTSPNGPAYGSAKRAVASLTWQVGHRLPEGITVNALSPIAASRMVRAALEQSTESRGGLDLTAMPQPHDMAPAAEYLSSESFGWCTGQVLFSAGTELSVIGPPRLIEAVQTSEVADFTEALGTLIPALLGPVEAGQSTTGGSNPRIGTVFDQPAPMTMPDGGGHVVDQPTCVIVTDDTELGQAVARSVTKWGMRSVGVGTWEPFDESASELPVDFAQTAGTLRRAEELTGRIDALIIALGTTARPSEPAASSWADIVSSHRGSASRIVDYASWAHAGIELALSAPRPLRLVQLTRADSAAGRSEAQAIAQLARSANDMPTPIAVDCFAIGIEATESADYQPLADLVGRLVGADDGPLLRGAELFSRPNWLGLRSHPTPIATITFGGPEIPPWMDDALREAVYPSPTTAD
jgi:NAD(P)-dependent dehydrogenase (short-subunit alcohol dehydrogenase family)